MQANGEAKGRTRAEVVREHSDTPEDAAKTNEWVRRGIAYAAMAEAGMRPRLRDVVTVD